MALSAVRLWTLVRVCMESGGRITVLLLNRYGRQKPGEEERITADQSKHHVPFPLKAPSGGAFPMSDSNSGGAKGIVSMLMIFGSLYVPTDSVGGVLVLCRCEE